jgi:hypothetical protein
MSGRVFCGMKQQADDVRWHGLASNAREASSSAWTTAWAAGMSHGEIPEIGPRSQASAM